MSSEFLIRYKKGFHGFFEKWEHFVETASYGSQRFLPYISKYSTISLYQSLKWTATITHENQLYNNASALTSSFQT